MNFGCNKNFESTFKALKKIYFTCCNLQVLKGELLSFTFSFAKVRKNCGLFWIFVSILGDSGDC